MAGKAVVTGAFSYTGSAVATELLKRGWSVHTLTRRRPPPGAGPVTSAPLTFERAHLEAQLRGADLLVSTYWERLPYTAEGFGRPVRQSRMLFDAAAQAGVGRLVHVSVSNADARSKLGYYRGKAEVDAHLRTLGRPFAIVRPTLIVGPSDVLTSNIAWCLRRFPVFVLPDGGRYRLQPLTLGDAARIIADAAEASGDVTVDAAGPEVFTFREYVERLAGACGVRPWLVSAPAFVPLLALRALGVLLRDEVLTREELDGLAEERLVSHQPARGTERVGEWLAAHGSELGVRYVNDRVRHLGAGSTEPILSPGLSAGP